jgi:sugar phosphate isomerase/epimerase
MQLKLIRHLWGVDEPWDVCFPKFKADGYVGIETPLIEQERQERFASLLQSHEFDYIAMAFTGGDSVSAHVKSFEQQFRRAIELGAVQLTAHTGLDRWSHRDAESFYREALQIERSHPKLPVAHETHRGRAFFSPWATRLLLEKFDALKLCCDFSHWVCVAERTSWDESDGAILRLCADRCIHLHARVGYAEGPQVPDPSAPEYADELAAHEVWWDAIWRSQRSRGAAASTVTCEFGPPGYLHTLPHTNVPVADLNSIVNWMSRRVRVRFDGQAQ